MGGGLAPAADLVDHRLNDVYPIARQDRQPGPVSVVEHVEELRRRHAVEHRPRRLEPGGLVDLLFSDECQQVPLGLMFIEALLKPGRPSFGVGLGPGEAAPRHLVRSQARRIAAPIIAMVTEWHAVSM